MLRNVRARTEQEKSDGEGSRIVMDVDVGREAVIRESKHKKPKTCTSDAHSMRLPMPIFIVIAPCQNKGDRHTHSLTQRLREVRKLSRRKAKIENCMCVTDVRKQ